MIDLENWLANRSRLRTACRIIDTSGTTCGTCVRHLRNVRDIKTRDVGTACARLVSRRWTSVR